MIATEQQFEEQFREAERLRADGRLPEAVRQYQDLLDYRLRVVTGNRGETFSNYDAIVLERLADLSALFGHTRAALALLDGLAGLYQEAGNTYLYVYTLAKTGNLHLAAGDRQATMAVLGTLAPFVGDVSALDISTAGLVEWENQVHFPGCSPDETGVLLTRIHYLMGGLLTALGQYEQGLSCLERGIELVEKNKLPIARQALAALQTARAKACLQMGNLHRAGQLIAEHGQTDPAAKGAISSGDAVAWLELQSKLFLLRGELGKAEENLLNVSRICRDNRLFAATVNALANLAQTKILLNQVSDAGALLQTARTLAVEHQLGETLERLEQLQLLAHYRSTVSPGALNLSPRVKAGNGQPHGPLPAIRELNAGADYLLHFEHQSLVFQMLLGASRWDEAARWLENMRLVFQATDSRLIQTRLLIQEQLMAYYQNRLKILDYVPVQGFLQEQGLLPELWQYQRFLGWTNLLPATQQEHLHRQNEQLLDQMTQSLSPEKQAIYLLNKWTADEESLAGAVQQLMVTAGGRGGLAIFRKIRQWRQTARLLTRIDAYKAYITRRQTLENDPLPPAPAPTLPWWKRLLFHPGDQATISFLVLPDRVLIVYNTRFQLRCRITYISRIELRERVQQLYRLAIRGGGGRSIGQPKKQEAWSPDARAEAQSLLAQVVDLLQLDDILAELPARVKRLRIVPDDILNSLPFAAVRGQQGYLTERYALTIAYESSGQSRSAWRPGAGPWLLGAVAKGDARLTPLPGAQEEVEALQRDFSHRGIPTQVLLDDAAGKANLLRQLQTASAWHMACHGHFEHQRPDQTGLLLLNGEVLSLRDILATPAFGRLTHVTLSSCWAADHFILPGRWVISLPEVLKRAGVGGILGCMWEVDDRVAVPFVRQFYAYAEQLPRDQALQHTRLDALHNRLPDCPVPSDDPFFWSGFNFYQ